MKIFTVKKAWSMYSEKEMSLTQIGQVFNMTACQLRYRLMSKGYRLRTRTESLRLAFEQGRVRRGHRTGKDAPSWKGGRRVGVRGYIELHMPGHPRARGGKYVMEHIYVWEQANGPIPKGWHIHHVNGVKDDNRLENLLAMPSKEHVLYIATQQAKIRELESEIRRLKSELVVLREGR